MTLSNPEVSLLNCSEVMMKGGIRYTSLPKIIFLKPGLIWKLTEEWKSYRADEPSEFYLKTTKIGGILFALFGIIMIMLPVILE